MFTRQHYKAIAKIISDATSIDEQEFLYRDELIEALAWLFLEDNPQFNRTKFIDACNDKIVFMLSVT